MFQEPPDNAFNRDVFRHSRHAGPQATNTPYHQVNIDAGVRGVIEGINNLAVDQGIQLSPDGAGAPGFDVVDFLLNQGQNRFPQAKRRDL